MCMMHHVSNEKPGNSGAARGHSGIEDDSSDQGGDLRLLCQIFNL